MRVPVSAYPDWYVTVMSLYPQSFSTTFHSLYLAVNLGGCVIPLAISASLLINRQASIGKSLLGVAVVAAITYYAAEAVPGQGIVPCPSGCRLFWPQSRGWHWRAATAALRPWPTSAAPLGL